MSVWGEVCRHGRSWQEKAPLSRRCPSHKEAVGGEFAVGCSPFWPRVTASVPPGHASCLQVLDRELLPCRGALLTRSAEAGRGTPSLLQTPRSRSYSPCSAGLPGARLSRRGADSRSRTAPARCLRNSSGSCPFADRIDSTRNPTRRLASRQRTPWRMAPVGLPYPSFTSGVPYLGGPAAS